MRRSRRLINVMLLLPALAAAQAERSRDWDAGFHVADYSSLAADSADKLPYASGGIRPAARPDG